MPYVLRNPDGLITSLHREPQPGTDFALPDDPQVLAFLGGDEQHQKFASLDADLVRVLEDLIDTLIQRNILRVTDLPAEAQQKLFNRKHFRSSMKQYSLRLFGTDQDIEGHSEVVSTEMTLPKDPP